jgi:licheninase
MMTNPEGTEFADTANPIGRLKTGPDGPASFTFDFGSCNTGNHQGAYNAIAARNDDMFFHVGDLYYHDGSGTSLTNFRSRMGTAVTASQNLFATVNMFYIPSDHDGMNNDGANGSDPTAWTNWNIARSEHFPWQQSYQTWVWGRVRFIMLDTRSFKSNPANTDNSSKTALGTTQKQWLKDTINAATEPVIVIGQDTPWVTGTSAGDDAWGGFMTERNELASFIDGTNKNVVMLGGDMHALAANDGSSSPGGVPIFHAAPFNQAASHKGGPYTQGPYPAAGPTVQQYGRVVVTDSGTQISLAFNGYTLDGVSRLSLTKNYTVSAPPSTSRVNVHRVAVDVEPSTVMVNLHRVETTVVATNAAPRIHRIEVQAVGSADPGPNIRNLEAGLLVQMTAEAPGDPLSYTWDQVAGPSVTLTKSGVGDKTAAYHVPALRADADLVFRVVANYLGGTSSGSGITRHGVARVPNLMVNSDASLTPIEISSTPGTAPDPGGGDPDPGGGGGVIVSPGHQPLGVPGNWTTVLAENFDDLNRALWTPYWFSEGSQRNGVATNAANVAVANGELTLTLASSASGALISTNPNDFEPGHVGFTFNYGFVEARIFFPGSGPTVYNWVDFWTNGQTYPTNGLANIAESDSLTSGRLKARYHSGAPGAAVIQDSGPIPGNWGGSWHIYGLHRRPGQNDVYIDGQKVWSYLTNDAGAPHYIVLNVGNSTGNSVYGDASKVRVDYLRVWTDGTAAPADDGVQAATTLNWGPVVAGDEFNYTGPPDFNKWGMYDGPGHGGQGFRRPSAFNVADGFLRCTGLPDGTTGGMRAKFAMQTYGRWECRMRTNQRDPKYHPVLILWPLSGWNHPITCWEIDYAEGFGNHQQINFVNHHGCPGQTLVTRNIDTTQWHNYAVEWTSTRLRGWIDGVQWYDLTNTAQIPNVPMWQTIQLDWFPVAGQTTILSTMDVAWCRVYNL